MSGLGAADVSREIQRDLTRYGLIFIQLGAVHDPWREEVRSIGDRVFTAREFLSLESCTSGVVVIDGLEELSLAPKHDMSRLRSLILECMDSGCRFALVSKYPKSRFDRVPGSSLLLDATTTILPTGEFGSADDDSSGVWPVCNSSDATVEETAAKVFDELGVEILASLDHAVYESFLAYDEMVASLSEREVEALYCAGLLCRKNGNYTWAIPNRLGEIKNALAAALAAVTSPQNELADIFAELWSLERLLRREVRTGLESTLGDKWRSKCLHGNLESKVLAKAKEDVYAGAKSLKELRDPLEWLSLGELLEVRERSGIGDLGVEPVVWAKFRREILPVRNRVSHMRLVRSGDLGIVQQWAAVFRRKL